MSSRVLSQGSTEAVAPIVWRIAGANSATPTYLPANFQPSESIASAEVAQLRSRIAELEVSCRNEAAEAYRKGLATGETQGRTQEQAAVKPVLERMAQSAGELCDLKPKLRRQAEGDVVQLAIAIARRILHRELSLDPGAMQALAQVAIGKLERQEIHRVWVHPSQAAALEALLAGPERQVEVVGDAKRDLGSLLFETNRGKLDASINAQFEEIERGLTDRMSRK